MRMIQCQRSLRILFGCSQRKKDDNIDDASNENMVDKDNIDCDV